MRHDERSRLNALRRQVLYYLRQQGRQNSHATDHEFDLAYPEPMIVVLQDYLQWKYVERHHKDVLITEAGLRLLQSGTTWN